VLGVVCKRHGNAALVLVPQVVFAELGIFYRDTPSPAEGMVLFRTSRMSVISSRGCSGQAQEYLGGWVRA